MADTRYVRGLDELQKVLDTFPEKLQRNVMRGGLRAGMRVVQPVARANVHPVSGLLARGLRIFTGVRRGVVMAYLRTTGRHAHVAAWVEYGTAAHTILAKAKKALAFGGTVTSKVEHPGARPKPFMRPALDGQATAAVVATGNYIKQRLATKHGLDTQYIMVEGDE